MIRELKRSDISGLNGLPPESWKFDYENFLNDFYNEPYFKAFGLIVENELIGTGNVLFRDKIGWLANIIVAQNWRGKGFGLKITDYLCNYLKEKGCETQLLIATPSGEPLYERIGFRKIAVYHSFETESDNKYEPIDYVRELSENNFESVVELDLYANGEDRRHLLKKFYKSGYGYFNSKNKLLGFYLPEFGRGLVLAIEKVAGIELLKLKHSKKGKRTLLPLDNEDGIDFFRSGKFKIGDTCCKMVLGRENEWNPNCIYSYGGGYCG